MASKTPLDVVSERFLWFESTLTPGLCVRLSPPVGEAGNKLASVSSTEIFTVKHLLNSLCK